MLPEFCSSADASTVSEAKQTQCDVHRLQASERGYRLLKCVVDIQQATVTKNTHQRTIRPGRFPPGNRVYPEWFCRRSECTLVGRVLA